MRIHITLPVLGLAGSLLLAGCAASEPETVDVVEAPAAATTTPVVLEGYDAIAADGAGEAAALDAAPGVFDDQREADAWPEADWDALASVEPRFVAYLVRVDFDDQAALFEVRADGVPHNLYAYQKAFDSGSIIWTPTEDARGSLASPASAGETQAVAAVEAAMRDAFPDDSFEVGIAGYRVAYVAEGVQPLVIEIDPDGSLISVSM